MAYRHMDRGDVATAWLEARHEAVAALVLIVTTERRELAVAVGAGACHLRDLHQASFALILYE